MFSDVARKRGDDEIEEYFTVGTRATTPTLAAIDAGWPRPRVFLRVFALALALYTGFVWAWQEFGNTNLIPGLIMVGSVVMPFSLLIFFFEMNAPRNVSLYQVIRLLLVGGLVSIVVSLFGYQWAGGGDSWAGAIAAGIIEEIGKAVALLLVVRKLKYRWTLNGLLLGATVGTGFAVFESAGYALNAALGSGAEAMRETIMLRGILSVLGGHVLWTALVGAALWRLRGDQPFRTDMLFDTRFLRVLGICVLMHATWDSPIQLPVFGKYIILGFAAWLLVLGFIEGGLKEIRRAQAAPAAPTPAPAADATQPAGVA
jgi:RsiW-degrading membrane proteinase PrsW (M82 family)